MTQENALAILAFGHLTTTYAFASPHPPGTILFAGLCSSTGVPEWLYLIRGAREIMAIVKGWIVAGPLSFQAGDVDDFADLGLSLDDHHLVALEQKLKTSELGRLEERWRWIAILKRLVCCVAVLSLLGFSSPSLYG